MTGSLTRTQLILFYKFDGMALRFSFDKDRKSHELTVRCYDKLKKFFAAILI